MSYSPRDRYQQHRSLYLKVLSPLTTTMNVDFGKLIGLFLLRDKYTVQLNFYSDIKESTVSNADAAGTTAVDILAKQIGRSRN